MSVRVCTRSVCVSHPRYWGWLSSGFLYVSPCIRYLEIGSYKHTTFNRYFGINENFLGPHDPKTACDLNFQTTF